MRVFKISFLLATGNSQAILTLLDDFRSSAGVIIAFDPCFVCVVRFWFLVRGLDDKQTARAKGWLTLYQICQHDFVK